MTDFVIRNEGSIIILSPISDRARAWVDINLTLETWQDPTAIPIEPRMFEDLADGIVAEGMSIGRGETTP
jgi:hypothetical protein